LLLSRKFECNLLVFPDDGFDTRKHGHTPISRHVVRGNSRLTDVEYTTAKV